MRTLVSIFLLLFSSAAFSYQETTLMCIESGQTAPVILARYYQATQKSEKDYVILTKYFADNSNESEELRGEEPDLSFESVKTSEGERLLLIFSIKDTNAGMSVRVLSCIYQ